jgi:hypothetical protein
MSQAKKRQKIESEKLPDSAMIESSSSNIVSDTCGNRYINLDFFAGCGQFPNDSEILQSESGPLDRENSLVIFISYAWFNGKPDTEENSVYKLCLEGIRKIKDKLAPSMRFCYIWIWECCLDQSLRLPMQELILTYETVMSQCDCVYTPILDPELNAREIDTDDLFTRYCAPHFDAYKNRGWCLMETLLAANHPVTDDSLDRFKKLRGVLGYHHLRDWRAHFIYGTGESNRQEFPLVLPPLELESRVFEKWNPQKATFYNEDDRQTVDELMKKLKVKKRVEGYSGDTKDGAPHGLGRMRYPDGSEFFGYWVKGDAYRGTRYFPDGRELAINQGIAS